MTIQALRRALLAHKKTALIVGGLVLATAVGSAGTMVRRAEASTRATDDVAIVRVPAELAGAVGRIEVAKNQAVKKGDLLVVLEDEHAEAALALADASFASAEADARLADIEAARAVSDPTKDNSTIQLARARATSARTKVEAARATFDLAEIELYQTRILAPRDGVVSVIAVSTGDGVSVGQVVVWLTSETSKSSG
jgi:membrane fusion protein, multidrug efflux system